MKRILQKMCCVGLKDDSAAVPVIVARVTGTEKTAKKHIFFRISTKNVSEFA
jgi:hypothetical protein